MSNKKIKILPLTKPKSNRVIKQYSSVDQLLFYLEVLRGEVMIKESSTNEKNKISQQLDGIKSFLLDIESVGHDIKINYKNNDKIEYLHDFPGFIGNNPTIRGLIEDSAKWAQTPYPVLISGETGTGKEMFARLIHHISDRKNFLPINCGAIPPSLIESELFGHTKGAFTGAHQSRKGKFEESKDGTIFLDEIGELDDYIQVKLLRVIQFGEIQRLGSDKIIKVNTRIIAATNKKIKEQIENGKLREDLYYRLACWEIKIPPLRERRDEIPDLLKHFMLQCSTEIKKPLPELSKTMKEFLYKEYSFPGNVRELENIARRIIVLGNEHLVQSKLISEFCIKDSNYNHSEKLADKIEILTKDLIISTLEKFKGSVQKSALGLDISESRFYQLCRKFQVTPANFQ